MSTTFYQPWYAEEIINEYRNNPDARVYVRKDRRLFVCECEGLKSYILKRHTFDKHIPGKMYSTSTYDVYCIWSYKTTPKKYIEMINKGELNEW